MPAEHHSANADGQGPNNHRNPQQGGEGRQEGEEHGQHDGPGGVARREAELVHTFKSCVLVIYIVSRAPAPGEGFSDGNNDNVDDETEQDVDKDGAVGEIETSYGQNQPGNAMAGYLVIQAL